MLSQCCALSAIEQNRMALGTRNGVVWMVDWLLPISKSWWTAL